MAFGALTRCEVILQKITKNFLTTNVLVEEAVIYDGTNGVSSEIISYSLVLITSV